eukprot:scaffold927_cov230-Pinguiococcus_pyrenoidosus.AAC.10
MISQRPKIDGASALHGGLSSPRGISTGFLDTPARASCRKVRFSSARGARRPARPEGAVSAHARDDRASKPLGLPHARITESTGCLTPHESTRGDAPPRHLFAEQTQRVSLACVRRARRTPPTDRDETTSG